MLVVLNCNSVMSELKEILSSAREMECAKEVSYVKKDDEMNEF